MRYIFSILLCVILQTGFSQIVKTVGYSYTNGTPVYTPAKAGSALALDTVTWRYYTWNGSTWLSDGFRVQTISGCAAPAYTPTKFQSYLVINACAAGQGGPELYFWTGSVWLQINEGSSYTAGTGIAISGGNVISNTGDLSATNELVTTFDVNGEGFSKVIRLIDAGGTKSVSLPDIIPPTNSGTGISLSGTAWDGYTITNTAPNVVQELSIAGQDLTLSGGGGTVAIPAGSDTAIFSPQYFPLYNVTRGSGHPNVVGILDSVLTVSGSFGSTTLTVTGGTPSVFASTAFTCVVYDGNRYYSYSCLSVVGSTITLSEPLKTTVTSGTFKCMHDAAGGYHLTNYGYRAFADALYDYMAYTLDYKGDDKIVFLGDSWTQKTDIEVRSLTKRFKFRVNGGGGDSTTVINAGHGGMTSAWGRYWLDSLVLKQHPKYAVIEFFINDYRSTYSDPSLFTFSATDPFGSGSEVGATTLQQWYNNIEYMVKTCIDNNIIPIIVEPCHVADVPMTNMLLNAYLVKLPTTENVLKVSSQWVPAIGGIKYTGGKVGIGTTFGDPNGDFSVVGSSPSSGILASFRNSGLSNILTLNNDGRTSIGGTGTAGYRLAISGNGSFPTSIGVIKNGGGGEWTISNQDVISHYTTITATSGSNNNIYWFNNTTGTGFVSSSGTPTFNVISMQPNLNMTGTTSAIARGIFYDPNIISSTGLSNIAFQNTTGDLLFNTTSGSLMVGAATPLASAKVAISSTTQGFLPPRMTTVQRDAIASPATGLTLFCTDATATDGSTGVMQVWNGSTWKNAW